MGQARKTAYVANQASGTVTPIQTATGTAAKPIPVEGQPLRYRDHAERRDRLRRQLRLGHGHPDPDRQQRGRQTDPGREQPHFHRDHAVEVRSPPQTLHNRPGISNLCSRTTREQRRVSRLP